MTTTEIMMRELNHDLTMTVYENYNYEIIKMVVNGLVRYGVKPKGVKGFDYVSSDLDKAISQADYYDTLPLVRTWDI